MVDLRIDITSNISAHAHATIGTQASAYITTAIINKTKYTQAALFIGRVHEQQISEYLPSYPFHRYPNKRAYIPADLKIVVNTGLSRSHPPLSLSPSLLFPLANERADQREKNQLSRLCEISMQLRAIAKSSHAIDGRIIERPSTSLGHGCWFHLRSSCIAPSFFHPSSRFY